MVMKLDKDKNKIILIVLTILVILIFLVFHDKAINYFRLDGTDTVYDYHQVQVLSNK